MISLGSISFNYFGERFDVCERFDVVINIGYGMGFVYSWQLGLFMPPLLPSPPSLPTG
jgi:hypothetical protein